MTAYILRRALSSVVVALLVSVFVFLAINLQKGSVIEANLAALRHRRKDEVDALRTAAQAGPQPA